MGITSFACTRKMLKSYMDKELCLVLRRVCVTFKQRQKLLPDKQGHQKLCPCSHCERSVHVSIFF